MQSLKCTIQWNECLGWSAEATRIATPQHYRSRSLLLWSSPPPFRPTNRMRTHKMNSSPSTLHIRYILLQLLSRLDQILLQLGFIPQPCHSHSSRRADPPSIAGCIVLAVGVAYANARWHGPILPVPSFAGEAGTRSSPHSSCRSALSQQEAKPRAASCQHPLPSFLLFCSRSWK